MNDMETLIEAFYTKYLTTTLTIEESTDWFDDGGNDQYCSCTYEYDEDEDEVIIILNSYAEDRLTEFRHEMVHAVQTMKGLPFCEEQAYNLENSTEMVLQWILSPVEQR